MYQDILEFARAFGTPAAACVGSATAAWVAHKFGSIQARIAQQQADTAALVAKTARNKLKFEQFDRRLVIYKATQDVLAKVSTHGRLTDEDESGYLIGTSGAHWLFDKAVVEYLERTLWHAMIDFRSADQSLRDADAHTDRRKAVERRGTLRQVLMDQRPLIDSMFEPYLKQDL